MNPYDRRRGERVGAGERAGATSDPGWAQWRTHLGLGQVQGPALTLEDIDAMIRAAQRRALREAELETDAIVQNARRAAWDEGHAVGVEAGRAELLRQIDERVGTKAREQHQAGMALLAKVGENPRHVSKAELERRLDAAVDTLAELISEHHNGFVSELPF